MIMYISLAISSVLLAIVHQNNNLVKIPYLLSFQILHLHLSCITLIIKSQVVGPRHEKIVDLLVVNFKIGHPYLVLMILIYFYVTENILDGTWKNTRRVRRTKHSIRLT